MDKGIVLYLTGDGSGSYTTVQGAAGSVGTLSTTYASGTAFQIGRAQNATIAISMGFASSTGIVVKCEAQRIDYLNSSTFNYSPIQTMRSDDGTVAFEHTFASTATDVFLQTSGQKATGNFKISAKSSDVTSASGDFAIFGVDVT